MKSGVIEDNYDVTTVVAATTSTFDENGFRNHFGLTAQDDSA